ncbi:DegQ family serine endoprotease [soil metagenome]
MTIRAVLAACAIAGLIVAPAASQTVERRVPTDVVSMKSSFAPIVHRVAPAVVNVLSKRTVRQRPDPFWDFFSGGNGVPRERVEQSLGSGAIVRADGVVVTNHHVIDGMAEISVVLSDRRQFPARLLLDDPRSDLAVLKIDAGDEKLPVLHIGDREDVEVGDLVLAIGNPFGVGQTVTNGIVSALARTDVGVADYSSFIQTDAAINPGNSGGPLIDMSGDLIGLNTMILSPSGQSSGVGFAIPAIMVRQVVDAAVGGRRTVERPWLGLKTQAVDIDTAKSLGLPGPRGVMVTQLYPKGPAERAGLREGDIILDVDGQPVNDEGGVNYRVATRHPNDPVQLRIRRSGAERTLTARAEAPPVSPPDLRTLVGSNPFAGATVSNLSPGDASARGVDPFQSAVQITAVDPASVAARVSQLRQGDLILEVNGRKVSSTGELQTIVDNPTGRVWQIAIQRGGQVFTAQLRI